MKTSSDQDPRRVVAAPEEHLGWLEIVTEKVPDCLPEERAVLAHLSSHADGVSAISTPGNVLDIARALWGDPAEWRRVSEALRTLERHRLVRRSSRSGPAAEFHLCAWVDDDDCYPKDYLA